MVLGGAGEGPELLGSYSTTWPGTEEVMGWELIETGLKVQLSKSVPTIVLEKLRPNLEAACVSAGLDFSDLEHFILHPGGAKVLDAFEEVFDLEPGGLTFSRGVLRDCGNMSAVTVPVYPGAVPGGRRVRPRRTGSALGHGAGVLGGTRLVPVLILLAAISLLVFQRLLELRYSRKNERLARAKGAVERGRGHYPFMVAIHALWIVSTLVEGLLRGLEFPAYWPAALAVFLLVQPLRYWAILSLGESWNVRVLVVPGAKLVRRGPYRFLRHPNYVVVAVEILSFPLIFGAWITALVLTILNAAFLYARVHTENRALSELNS